MALWRNICYVIANETHGVMWRIKDFHNRELPPGQFWFEQEFEANGHRLKKHWPATSEAGMLASQVARFRKGNNLPRATASEALQDISSFVCARNSNNPKWCIDDDTPWPEVVASNYGPNCRTCGGGTQT
jgi:hypothetical protein